jgi:hypothetical protein
MDRRTGDPRACAGPAKPELSNPTTTRPESRRTAPRNHDVRLRPPNCVPLTPLDAA